MLSFLVPPLCPPFSNRRTDYLRFVEGMERYHMAGNVENRFSYRTRSRVLLYTKNILVYGKTLMLVPPKLFNYPTVMDRPKLNKG